jgi:hypothetical protein
MKPGIAYAVFIVFSRKLITSLDQQPRETGESAALDTNAVNAVNANRNKRLYRARTAARSSRPQSIPGFTRAAARGSRPQSIHVLTCQATIMLFTLDQLYSVTPE